MLAVCVEIPVRNVGQLADTAIATWLILVTGRREPT